MKSNIIKEFNLPGYIKGKSFAEASKAIDSKFKDRTDPYAQKTKEDLLERLAEAQEYVKMKEQAAKQSMQQSMNNNSQEVPDEMNGQIPQGMEEFIPQQQEQQIQPQQGMQEIQNMMESQNQKEEGGFLSTIGKNANSDKMAGAGAIMEGAQQTLGFGKDLFGKTGVDTSGNSDYMQKKSTGMDAAGGALSGAAAGAQIGGVPGAIVGGAIGGISKFIGAKKANKDIEEANQKRDLKLNSKIAPNTFAKGGYINKYKDGGYVPGALIQPDVLDFIKKQGIDKNTNASTFGANEIDYSKLDMSKKFGPSKTESAIKDTTEDIEEGIKKYGKKGLDFLDKNKEDLLRISPVAYNLFRANNLDEAEVIKRQTLDNKYNPQYMNVNQIVNQVDQNNVNKALSESSGGNLGALRSSILAANLNKDKAKSKAYAQSDQVNRSEDSKKQQFDTQIDKLNLSQENQDLVDNMQNRGARETAKRNLEAAGISQLGQIGKEAQDRKIAAEATGYKYNGEFIKTDDGTEIKPSELGLTEKDGKFYDENGYELSEKEVAKKAKNYKKK
jgi:hypothetical protein